MGCAIKESLLVDDRTLLKKDIHSGRILVLIKNGTSCPKQIRVRDGRRSFLITVDEDRSLVTVQWIKDFLELKEDEGEKGTWQQSIQGSRKDGDHSRRVDLGRNTNLSKGKGKMAVTKSPKVRPSLGMYSNLNPKLILDKKRGIRSIVEQPTSSSSDSGNGSFGKLGLLRGESSHHNKILVSVPDPTRGVDLVFLDFSVADSDNGLDQSGIVPILGAQSKSHQQFEKSGPHSEVEEKEAKNIQLMMKNGLLKTSLVRHWSGQYRLWSVKEKKCEVSSGARVNSQQLVVVEGSASDDLVPRQVSQEPTPDVPLFNSFNDGKKDFGTRVVDVEGNEVGWHLDGEISRVIETGAALGLNVGGNGMTEESEMVVDVEGNKVAWNVEAEITGVLEVAVALGIDFGSSKKAIRGEISRREKANFERLRGDKSR
ncbi:hypothetical protein Q3G72_032183 [Acer saccharum]|nr:hypothetical protein Q3G72_032183 [Acer saccharum]